MIYFKLEVGIRFLLCSLLTEVGIVISSADLLTLILGLIWLIGILRRAAKDRKIFVKRYKLLGRFFKGFFILCKFFGRIMAFVEDHDLI